VYHFSSNDTAAQISPVRSNLRRHRGDDAKIQGIFILLLFTMMGFQMGLHAWKQKYPKAYTRVTLVGMCVWRAVRGREP
jgi:hypothetical protein